MNTHIAHLEYKCYKTLNNLVIYSKFIQHPHAYKINTLDVLNWLLEQWLLYEE